MPRTVFFSFHYQRDIMRVQIVKNHYVTKGNYTAAGFFDGSLEEKAKKEGDDVVKRLINKGLNGCSVTCVLIGAETYTRRWVDYEIFKSVELGMGVFGIRIHKIPDARRASEPSRGIDSWGSSPFVYLGYGRNEEKLLPKIKYKDGWKDAPYQAAITEANAPYLEGTDRPVLDSLFKVYDWVDDNGYKYFGDWLEDAADQAGR
jgi:hypothetical protein